MFMLKRNKGTFVNCSSWGLIEIRSTVPLIATLYRLLIFLLKNVLTKELSLWNKIKYLNLNTFRTRCCNPLIFQNQIISSKIKNSQFEISKVCKISKDIVIRKSEFVAKTQYFGVFFRSYILFPVLFTFYESCKNNRLFLQFSKFPNFKNYRLQNLNLFFILLIKISQILTKRLCTLLITKERN